jgi:hypothetical protein
MQTRALAWVLLAWLACGVDTERPSALCGGPLLVSAHAHGIAGSSAARSRWLLVWAPHSKAEPMRAERFPRLHLHGDAAVVQRMCLRGGTTREDDDESEDPDFEPMEKSGSGEDIASSSAAIMRASGAESDIKVHGERSGSIRGAQRKLSDAAVDSDILDDSSEGDPTDDDALPAGFVKGSDDALSLEGGGSIDETDGKAGVGRRRAEEFEEEDEEDEEDEMDEMEDDDEAEGIEEAVEEEVEESIPEEEKGEAREARLMAQKLKNRTDLRQERLKQIVQRYETRERHKGTDKKKAREQYQAQLEQFLGILPPAAPKSLHQLVSGDQGALAVPPEEEQRDTAAELVFNDDDTLVLSKASQVSLHDAVRNLRAGQTIEVKLGSYRWSRAVRVGPWSLAGRYSTLLLNSTLLLYSTPLLYCSALLYSSILYSILLLCSTALLLYSTLLSSPLLYSSTLLDQPVKQIPEPSPGNSIVKPTATGPRASRRADSCWQAPRRHPRCGQLRVGLAPEWAHGAPRPAFGWALGGRSGGCGKDVLGDAAAQRVGHALRRRPALACRARCRRCVARCRWRRRQTRRACQGGSTRRGTRLGWGGAGARRGGGGRCCRRRILPQVGT